MKTFAKSKLIGSVWLASALFPVTDGFAHTTRSRPVEAAVETINLQTQTLTIAPIKDCAPSLLKLTQQTKFVHNEKFAAANELRPGTPAVVYYRSPFFGKPFVTKIVWPNGN